MTAVDLARIDAALERGDVVHPKTWAWLDAIKSLRTDDKPAPSDSAILHTYAVPQIASEQYRALSSQAQSSTSQIDASERMSANGAPIRTIGADAPTDGAGSTDGAKARKRRQKRKRKPHGMKDAAQRVCEYLDAHPADASLSVSALFDKLIGAGWEIGRSSVGKALSRSRVRL